jgi:very-short-patch-repair endonuclease
MRTRNIPRVARAQTLRAASTEPETKLWRRLRDRRLGGAKFVRQAPVGPYYADFICRAGKLIVELDGSQHADSAYDDRRDAILVGLGYRVLRFWNADVLDSIDDVCETIVAAVEGRLAPFERFKTVATACGAAPHPAPKPVVCDGRLPTPYGATFPPQAGGRE